jgi:hypothetical protein
MDKRQKEKKDVHLPGKENKQHPGAPDMNHQQYGKHSKDRSGGQGHPTNKKQGNSI